MPCGAVRMCGQAHRFFQFPAHHASVSFEYVRPLVPDLFKCQLIFGSRDGPLFHQARLAKALPTVDPIILPANLQGEVFKLFLIHHESVFIHQ